jgi:hypothetical protein
LKIDNSSANGQHDYPVFYKERNSDPYLAKEVSTIAECSLRHYRWGNNVYVIEQDAVGGTPALFNDFSHIVNFCCAFKKYQ